MKKTRCKIEHNRSRGQRSGRVTSGRTLLTLRSAVILLTASVVAAAVSSATLYLHHSITGGVIAGGGAFIAVTGFLNRIIE